MTSLVVGLSVLVVALWLTLVRLHAEMVVLRKDRDQAIKQLRALTMVYGKRVDRRAGRE